MADIKGFVNRRRRGFFLLSRILGLKKENKIILQFGSRIILGFGEGGIQNG